MGMEYILLDENSREYFDLGKGNWSNFLDVNIKDIYAIRDKIVNECLYHIDEDYALDLSIKIFSWALNKDSLKVYNEDSLEGFMRDLVVKVNDNYMWTNRGIEYGGDSVLLLREIGSRYES